MLCGFLADSNNAVGSSISFGKGDCNGSCEEEDRNEEKGYPQVLRQEEDDQKVQVAQRHG
jgi:hypothetical protein